MFTKINLITIFYLIGYLPLLSQDIIIEINTLEKQQVMQGFGSSERLFNDPHLIGGSTLDPMSKGLNISKEDEDEILDLLYKDLGLTRVRPAIGEDGPIEDPNDNSNPYITELDKFDFSWKKTDGHIDLVKRLIQRGVNTYFPSTIKLEDWMTESNPEEYVEWAFTMINRWYSKGLNIPFFAIMNEPGYKRGGYWSGHYIRDCIKLLGPKLDSAGFNTKFVIPDDLNADEAYKRAKIILEDVKARKYVGALAYHLYGGGNKNKLEMAELSKLYNIPVWMTEYSETNAFDWANDIHQLIELYNVSAIDYMWGFSGGNATLVSIKYEGTTYVGYELNKQFYVMGQYSKFIKPGSIRVTTTSSSTDINVTAFIDGANIIIVVYNKSNNSKIVDFNFKGTKIDDYFKLIRTSENENWSNLPSIKSNNNGFTTTIMNNSVTTFISEPNITSINRSFLPSTSSFNIYPNPTNQEIRVDGDLSSPIELELYNEAGKLILSKVISSDSNSIKINKFPRGMYFCYITTLYGSTSVRKFVVE